MKRRNALGEHAGILLRTSGVCLFASLADLGTLNLLMSVVGLPHRFANGLSVLPGLAVMFVGNKYFAFEDHSPQVVKQGLRFLFVAMWAFALKSLLFQFSLQELELSADKLLAANLLRLACMAAVYFGFSFPLWTFIFHKTTPQRSTPLFPVGFWRRAKPQRVAVQ